ncbi:glycosyltransferase [Lacticaseibacillus chiayiensis]|uniref:glycosyltransferase n=1 Tax=Lacticaseibacillus chiayiensis TaxID=2100821 RepID=UPI0010136C74|nr:glycosyltransferase [Lacticaseibacillus chiayiensis]QVI33932.1 glycosyltransferase [Lacticaseibacillus chiayiensis]RXT58118.1 hypothetical protein CHT97_08205 [Lacticaseibacillus chiayiensis]
MNAVLRVAVLISTYNGEKYIEDQIKSILSQKIDSAKIDLHLYIRDDGSEDNTRKILTKLAKEFVAQITFFQDDAKNLGVKQSFFSLIRNRMVLGDYFFLADQDDLWSPYKVNMTLSVFSKNRSKGPLGIYSDLWIADALGRNTNIRMSDQLPLNKNIKADYKFLSNHTRITGAAFAFNADARNLFRMVNPKLISLINMHDSFMALLLAACGTLVKLDEPLVLYRQHGDNLIGARTEKKSISQKILNFKRLQGQYIIDNVVLYLFLMQNNLRLSKSDTEVIGLYVKYFLGASHLKKRFKNGTSLVVHTSPRRPWVTFLTIVSFDVCGIIDQQNFIRRQLSNISTDNQFLT